MSLIDAITKLNAEITTYSLKPTEPVRMELELRIDACARKILRSKAPDKEAALHALAELRGKLVRNVSTYDQRLYLNLMQSIGPTPHCPYYNKYQVPTISSYHTIGSNFSTIRLDPSAVEHVPAEILEKLGDLSGKSLDLFSITVDGRPFVDLHRPINLCTHPWSHPHLIKNKHAVADTNMGVFPVVGFTRASDGGAIAFNNLSPMSVHAHDDLYSPDNAHFRVIPDTPYGIFWAVTQKNNRVAISKMIVLFDLNHPVCRAVQESIGQCPDVTTHAERLRAVGATQAATLVPIIDMFERDGADTMKAFDALPQAFRNCIYEQTWKLHGKPMGIHDDFGQASFYADKALTQQYRCTNKQRAQTIRMFFEKLDHELVGSQLAMFQHQRLAKGDNVLKMMTCAKLFNGGLAENAEKLFASFTPKEQEDVYRAMWELVGCQLVHDIGSTAFNNAATPLQQKAEALLLAASRQTHIYDKPLELTMEEEEPGPSAPFELAGMDSLSGRRCCINR